MFRLLPRALHFPGAVLFLALTAVLTPAARAAQDVVQFGNTIEVGQKDNVQDAICFFCGVNVKGTVNGDIVAFFGNVRLEGHTSGDVVNFFGDVQAGDGSEIGGDLVNFFGAVRLGEDARVNKDTVVMFGSLRAADTASVGGDRVVQPGWLFWGPLLVIVLAIYFVVHEFRSSRRRRMLGGY